MILYNMSKKEFLVKVLERIGDSWKLGNALLILLKNDELNDEQTSKLVSIMEDSLKSVEENKMIKRIWKRIYKQ